MGTDILRISRIEEVQERLGERFVRRILTPPERAEYQRSSMPARLLAKRFAAKEAIAKALGGAVTKNPQGWVLGRFETHNHTPAPWMNTAPGPMALHAAHKEQVSAPPPGAQILAGTDTVPNGHMALGRKVFSTQYHPELDHAFMMALFDEMEGEADASVLNAARAGMEGPVDSAQMARWIVAFFEQAKA